MTPSPRFVKAGLPTDGFATKLWQVTGIINKHGSPWGADPFAHTEVQMDWLMEMYVKDNPDEYEFNHPGRPKPLKTPNYVAAWDNALSGEFVKKYMPAKHILDAARQITEYANLVGGIGAGVRRDPNDPTKPEKPVEIPKPLILPGGPIINIGKLKPE